LWALHIAASLPQSGGESLLIEGLQHAHGGVREWAADRLEPIATSASIDALRRAAKDTVRQVRYRSITALSRLDGQGNLDIFLDALEDEDSGVRYQAREALSKAGGPAVVARVLEILRTPDKMYREDAGKLLGEVGDESAIPALIDTLQDVEIFEAAVDALGKLVKPGMPAVAILEKLASDSDKTTRDRARRALCRIADPSSIHILSQMLDDGDEYGAEDALKRIHKPEARRVLAEWRRKHR
jgi:HEAT repeat protein